MGSIRFRYNSTNKKSVNNLRKISQRTQMSWASTITSSIKNDLNRIPDHFIGPKVTWVLTKKAVKKTVEGPVEASLNTTTLTVGAALSNLVPNKRAPNVWFWTTLDWTSTYRKYTKVYRALLMSLFRYKELFLSSIDLTSGNFWQSLMEESNSLTVLITTIGFER